MNRPTHDENDTRERIIRDYIEALDTGSLDAQDRLLTEAMAFCERHGDTTLESTLWEAQIAVGAELEADDVAALVARKHAEAAEILNLAQASFSTPAAASRAELQAEQAALMAEDEALEEPPPLTLGEVAARLRVDLARTPPRFAPAVRNLVARLESHHGGVPVERMDLSERGARSLLGRLGLETAGSWLGKQFHEALLSLQISREQELRLAAARRSRSQRQRPDQRQRPAGPRPADAADGPEEMFTPEEPGTQEDRS
jgi:hypothetical protein